jgi:hypothetical protein
MLYVYAVKLDVTKKHEKSLQKFWNTQPPKHKQDRMLSDHNDGFWSCR